MGGGHGSRSPLRPSGNEVGVRLSAIRESDRSLIAAPQTTRPRRWRSHGFLASEHLLDTRVDLGDRRMTAASRKLA
jgi:hypothetical protein